MAKIIIIGAGGHGQVVADILMSQQRAGEAVAPIGFIDAAPALKGRVIFDLPVLGDEGELGRIEHDAVVVAIGDNAARQKTAVRLAAAGERFISAIHPSAVIAEHVRMAAGCMVCAGAIVNTGSVIGEQVILNTGCTVDHHNLIGDFTHIAPGVHLGGEVIVGQGVLIGIGSCVLPRMTIGDWAMIGAGGVVRKIILPGATAVGNPCRVIKIRPLQE